MSLFKAFAVGIALAAAAGNCMGGETMVEADQKTVADLDIQYQAAVERNDAEGMARIHHDNMTLVISNGTVITGEQLEQAARDKVRTYERQVVVDDAPSCCAAR